MYLHNNYWHTASTCIIYIYDNTDKYGSLLHVYKYTHATFKCIAIRLILFCNYLIKHQQPDVSLILIATLVKHTLNCCQLTTLGSLRATCSNTGQHQQLLLIVGCY